MKKSRYSILESIRQKLLQYHQIILLLSILYFISNIFWGLDLTDGFFHINEATQVTGYYPFETVLTSQIISMIYKVIGKQIIIYRFINSLLFLSSFLLIWNLIKEKYHSAYLSLLFSAFIIITCPINFNIFGFDSFSIVAITLTVWFILKSNLEKKSSLVILSLLIAASALIRLPNIMLLCFVPVYFVHLRKENSGTIYGIIIKTAILGVLTIIIYSTYLFLIFHHWKNAFGSFASQQRHGISHLLHHYKIDLVQMFYFLIPFLVLYVINLKQKKYNIIITSALFITLFTYIYHNIYFVYHWLYSLMIFAFISSVVLINLITSRKLNFKIIFLFLTTTIIAIGSNTGFLKVAFLCPIGLLCILESSKYVDRKYILYSLLCFMPFSYMVNLNCTFEDYGYSGLKSSIDIKGLNPIRTTEGRKKMLQEIIANSNQYEKKGYKVIYYGFNSHLFSFLNPAPRNHYTFDQPMNRTNELRELLTQYSNKKLAFHFTGIPKNDTTSTPTDCEQFLIQKGFNKDSTSNYCIYYNH